MPDRHLRHTTAGVDCVNPVYTYLILSYRSLRSHILLISSRRRLRPLESNCLTFASVCPVARATSPLSISPNAVSRMASRCPAGSESISTPICRRVSAYSVRSVHAASNADAASSEIFSLRRRKADIQQLRNALMQYALPSAASPGILSEARHRPISVSCTASAASSGGIPIRRATLYIALFKGSTLLLNSCSVIYKRISLVGSAVIPILSFRHHLPPPLPEAPPPASVCTLAAVRFTSAVSAPKRNDMFSPTFHCFCDPWLERRTVSLVCS